MLQMQDKAPFQSQIMCLYFTDTKLKTKIYPEIKSILNDNKITCLMVTHDLTEVKALADKLFNLESGKLVEI